MLTNFWWIGQSRLDARAKKTGQARRAAGIMTYPAMMIENAVTSCKIFFWRNRPNTQKHKRGSSKGTTTLDDRTGRTRHNETKKLVTKHTSRYFVTIFKIQQQVSKRIVCAARRSGFRIIDPNLHPFATRLTRTIPKNDWSAWCAVYLDLPRFVAICHKALMQFLIKWRRRARRALQRYDQGHMLLVHYVRASNYC